MNVDTVSLLIIANPGINSINSRKSGYSAKGLAAKMAESPFGPLYRDAHIEFVKNLDKKSCVAAGGSVSSLMLFASHR